MDVFSILQILTWVLIGASIFLTAATAGFDFGAGMLQRLITKNESERRVIINTVSPTWDGNQVWIIIFGAGLFAIWPKIYAASFSGMYLAVLTVLWALYLRPVAFEYRSKFKSAKTRGFWDWMLFIGSLVPILIFGVAVGNLFLGFPITYNNETMRFYYAASAGSISEFGLLSLVKLLMPFALLFGIFAVVMSLMHGASYCAMRTVGSLKARLQKVQIVTSIVFIVLFIVGGVWLLFIDGYHYSNNLSSSLIELTPFSGTVTTSTGGWYANYLTYPWMLIAPILGFVGAFGVLTYAKKDNDLKAFISSVIAVLGAVLTFGFSLFPFLMPSFADPSQSLVLWNSTSTQMSITGILVAAAIILPITLFYTTFVYKKMWGRDSRMTVEIIEEKKHILY